MRRSAILLSLLALTGCIQTYPNGMNQQQWVSLTPAQQQAIIAEQQRQAAIAQAQQEAAARAEQAQMLEGQKMRLEQNARMRLGITDPEWLRMPEQQRFAIRQEQEQIERTQLAPAPIALPPQPYGQPVYGQPGYAPPPVDHSRLYTNPTYGSLVDCQISGGNAKFDQGWRPLGVTTFSIAKGDAQNVEIRRADKQRFTDHFWVGFSPNQELEFCPDADTDQRYKRCRKIAVTPAFEQGYTAAFNIPKSIDGASITCRYAQGRR